MTNKQKIIIVAGVILLLSLASLFVFRVAFSDFLVNQGQKSLFRQNLAVAKIFLDMAKIFNNQDANFYFVSGNVALLEKKYDEAIRYYSAALDGGFTPQERILLSRATLYEWQGDKDKALADYLEIQKINPNDPLVNYRIAAIYTDRNKAKEAITILEKVAGLTQTSIQKNQVYILLGRAYALDGHWQESADAYRKSLEIDSNQPNIAAWLSRSLRNAGDYSGAISVAEQALEKSPNSKPLLCALSGAYNKINEYDKAIAAGQKAIAEGDIDANSVVCLYHIGSAYYNKRDFSEAKSNLENVLGNIQKLAINTPEYQGLKSSTQYLLAKIK